MTTCSTFKREHVQSVICTCSICTCSICLHPIWIYTFAKQNKRFSCDDIPDIFTYTGVTAHFYDHALKLLTSIKSFMYLQSKRKLKFYDGFLISFR